MTTRRKKPAVPLPPSLLGPHRTRFVPPQDEFAGQGGSYVLDPVMGQRTLVDRTQAGPTVVPAIDKE